MTTWTATSTQPIEKPKDIEDIKPLDGRLPKQAKAQLEAAKQATAKLLPAFENPVNVALSGSEGQVQVIVARVQE